MKRVVLDASAVMAFFEGRPGAEKVEELINLAVEGKRELLMSVINWGEVYYSIWRTQGEEAANEKLEQIVRLPIEIVDVDIPAAKLAATLKVKFGLPYADCFAAALAYSRKAAIVTADADFKVLKAELELVFI